jgi:quercetin dioxygenase-like cupin family protein
MRALIATAAAVFAITTSAGAQNAAPGAGPQWVPVPPILPPGAKITLVAGDPTGPGPSTVQLWMPDGYKVPPHSHPSDERVEVVEGTLLVGMGDRLDPRKTLALAAGDTAVAPAGIHHFSIAKGPTVVTVSFMGRTRSRTSIPSRLRRGPPFPMATSARRFARTGPTSASGAASRRPPRAGASPAAAGPPDRARGPRHWR